LINSSATNAAIWGKANLKLISKPSEDRPERAAQKKTLRAHIFWIFALPYVILFGLLIALVEYQARETAVAAAKERFDLIANRLNVAVQRVERPAAAWLDSAVQNFEYGLENGNDQSDLRTHMFLLDTQAHIASVYFGYPNGEYVRVMALRDELERKAIDAPSVSRYAQQLVRKQADGSMLETWRFFGADKKLLQSAARLPTKQDPLYDPRPRLWYTQAQSLPIGSPTATAPYEFVLPRLYGITISTRLGGNLGGVGGVDFTLRGMSEFLVDVRGTNAVDTLMYDESGRILGWSQGSDLFSVPADENKLMRLADLRDATLKTLAQHHAAAGGADAGQTVKEIKAPDGQSYVVAFSAIAQPRTQGLRLAVFQRSDELFAPARRLRWLILAIAAAGLVGGVFLIAALAHRVARPLRSLSAQIQLLQHFKFREIEPIKSEVREIHALQESVLTGKVALASFSKYLPTPLVRHYLATRSEPKPTVEPRDVVAMHVVFHGPLYYNQFTDHRVSQQIQTIAAIIEGAGGMVDGYGNKGMQAIWNAPLIQPNAALRACQAAADMLAQARGKDMDLKLSVGIDQGRAGVGNFGNAARLIYGAVGEPVENARDMARSHSTSDSGVWVGAAVAKATQADFSFDAAGQLTTAAGQIVPVYRLDRKLKPDAALWDSSNPGDRPPASDDK
jgi:adenylate cyclase